MRICVPCERLAKDWCAQAHTATVASATAESSVRLNTEVVVRQLAGLGVGIIWATEASSIF